ncbi:MAG: DNA-binding protein [Verrucomicrobia bacterium]|nr:MAG: DNA-binding protein [Verrucomicrobiota bacterium]
MKKRLVRASPTEIESLIQEIRGQKVILDSDLALIYGVPTKRLNEQVKRNAERFPGDFLFRLTCAELEMLSRDQPGGSVLKSQIATSRGAHGGRRKLPFAFTEHGAIMAANVLNSSKAVQMSVFVVRAFVKMRAAFLDSRELASKLARLEQELKIRLNIHEAAIVDVLQRVMEILDPPPDPPGPPAPPKPQIGFHIKEEGIPYRVKRRSAQI